MKVLMPIDGSDYTKRMLAFVAAHDELFGAGTEFTACTVVTPVPVYAARFLDRPTLDAYYRDQAEAVFAPVREFAAHHGWHLSLVPMHGPVAETIASFAQDLKPDLIVMGSHGHSALASVALGSVASGVLARCKTPLLLIR